MTKPMYCPLTMIDKSGQLHECTPDCAWAVKSPGGQYGCSIAQAAATYLGVTHNEVFEMNARPLKDDAA